jgi:hypothetical protein
MQMPTMLHWALVPAETVSARAVQVETVLPQASSQLC